MKQKNKFSFLFRKSAIFRTVFFLFLILLSFVIIGIATWKARKIPLITSVTPPVGSPGDIMIIDGENFGSIKTTSDYVEVGGSKITASGYLSWQDNKIKIILPSNVQDGLVIVSTESGKSKPGFFANEEGIPVEVPPDTKTSLPIITSITPENPVVTGVLTLNGTNFGSIRNKGKVFFTANYQEENLNNADEKEIYVPVNDENFEVEYWSDSEIRVRVPEVAAGGQLFVQTEKGDSNQFNVNIRFPVGKKIFANKKTYVITLSTDIMNEISKNNTFLALRIPYPTQTSSQPLAKLTEVFPEPVFTDVQNTIIHQTELSKNSEKTQRFNHSFLVEKYSVQTEVSERNVKPYSEKQRVLYKEYTSPDFLIQSEDEDYVELAKKIVGKETNPYKKAKLIYDYMISNYEISEKLRKNGSNAKDLIEKEKGDAFDFAVVYTTLLRCSEIPSVMMAGILVDSDLKSKNHWWTEFYIENFGWIPVDVALGDGLEYKSFKNVENPESFYFGNLDSQHIAFSKGFNEIKSSIANSNNVYRERTYALQSIWEESSVGNVNYSSLWNDPVVEGIY